MNYADLKAITDQEGLTIYRDDRGEGLLVGTDEIDVKIDKASLAAIPTPYTPLTYVVVFDPWTPEDDVYGTLTLSEDDDKQNETYWCWIPMAEIVDVPEDVMEFGSGFLYAQRVSSSHIELHGQYDKDF